MTSQRRVAAGSRARSGVARRSFTLDAASTALCSVANSGSHHTTPRLDVWEPHRGGREAGRGQSNRRGGGAATTAQGRGCGGSALPPHQTMARLAAQHHKQPTRAATTQQKAEGRRITSPVLLPTPSGGQGENACNNNPQSDNAAGARAQDITGVMRTEGAPAVAQQLCITPCYVKAQSDLPSRLLIESLCAAKTTPCPASDWNAARRATTAPATARGLRFCCKRRDGAVNGASRSTARGFWRVRCNTGCLRLVFVSYRV